MRNPYQTYEQILAFSKSIGVNYKKLENELLRYGCREIYYNPSNDEVVLTIPDGDAIYIKKRDLL